MHSLDLVGSVF